MAVGDNLRTLLLADGTIAGLVAARMYPVQLPQKPTLPAIRYNTITAFRTQSQPGVKGLTRPRVQIDCYGETYAAARELADAVENKLNAYRGAAGSTSIQGAFSANENEFFDSDAKAYNVSRDYLIWLP